MGSWNPIEAARLLLKKAENSEVLAIGPFETGRAFRGRIDATEDQLIRYVASIIIEKYDRQVSGMMSIGLVELLLSEIEKAIDVGKQFSHPGHEAEKLRERISSIGRICANYRRAMPAMPTRPLR